ncbi:MAG: PD-(D/E)XK nuclease family protein [Muribaculaceae bacterium]|nr:PD-(D/E)XK nuclease family protein [Muribaculaceae bacterium]
MKLSQSSVVFDEYNHTYTTADGKELGGVTSLLARQGLTPDYSSIPVGVLNRAAEYGTAVHSALEVFDTLGVEDEHLADIIKAHSNLTAGLTHVDSEYLVTDGEHIASKIDKVYTHDGKTATLVDVKTTSKLHEDSVSWQLSIYAYLFEKMNPGIKVSALYAEWLPKPQYGLPEMKLIERKPDETVTALLEADAKGESFLSQSSDMAEYDSLLPDVPPEFWRNVISLENELARLQEVEAEIRKGLLATMAQHNVKKVETSDIVVTRKLAATSTRFDSKRFAEEHPELYNQYLTQTTSKETIQIKLRK